MWPLIVLTLVLAAHALPDLQVDNERLEKSFWIERRKGKACEIKEGCIIDSDEPRTLLRFDALIWNYGTMDFVIGRSKDYRVWDSCHQHYHNLAFANYNLTRDGVTVEESRKQGYNIADTDCKEGFSKYYVKSWQGISVGCGDLYASDIDCQFLDVTDYFGMPGNFSVSVVLNPYGIYPELNHSNNNIFVPVPAWEDIPEEPPLGKSYWSYRWVPYLVAGIVGVGALLTLILELALVKPKLKEGDAEGLLGRLSYYRKSKNI